MVHLDTLCALLPTLTLPLSVLHILGLYTPYQSTDETVYFLCLVSPFRLQTSYWQEYDKCPLLLFLWAFIPHINVWAAGQGEGMSMNGLSEYYVTKPKINET